MSRIAIIGTGYVGLVTGVCLADKGHQVTCVDVDPGKVAAINRGETPIYEPGLPTLLRRNIGRGLRATTHLAEAVKGSRVTLIAVGTPFDGRQIDLTFVREAARQVGEALRGGSAYHVVAVKSTVVPGTTEDVVKPILEAASGRRAGRDFGVGMNPEFLSEGEAVRDFMRPDRIVLGGMDRRTIQGLEAVYRGFRGVPIVRTTPKTAEMIKYASNSLLATLISFSNELGNLCSALGGVDANEVMEGVHLSQYLSLPGPRGPGRRAPIVSFLRAGCGFGGSCLPKDVQALIARGRQAGLEMPVLSSVIATNAGQPDRMLALARKHHRSLRGLPVTVLGLSFKPGTDDLRESPALPLVARLLRAGARVAVYDPVAMPAARRLPGMQRVDFRDSLGEAVRGARVVMVVTAWDEFKQLPALLRAGRAPLVVDGRRCLDKAAFRRYEGIGL